VPFCPSYCVGTGGTWKEILRSLTHLFTPVTRGWRPSLREACDGQEACDEVFVTPRPSLRAGQRAMAGGGPARNREASFLSGRADRRHLAMLLRDLAVSEAQVQAVIDAAVRIQAVHRGCLARKAHASIGSWRRGAGLEPEPEIALVPSYWEQMTRGLATVDVGPDAAAVLSPPARAAPEHKPRAAPQLATPALEAGDAPDSRHIAVPAARDSPNHGAESEGPPREPPGLPLVRYPALGASVSGSLGSDTACSPPGELRNLLLGDRAAAGGQRFFVCGRPSAAAGEARAEPIHPLQRVQLPRERAQVLPPPSPLPLMGACPPC
jgi:hypothetical protein